jgi:hypothetical protein
VLANAAACEVVGIRVVVGDAGYGQRVRLDYDLRVSSKPLGRRIVFDHRYCPVPIVPAETGGLELSRPDVRRELVQMTREYWGAIVDPRVVMNRLHQSGVTVPTPTTELRDELRGK